MMRTRSAFSWVLLALALPAAATGQRVEVGPRVGLASASTFTTYDPCPADQWCNVVASSPAARRLGAVVGVSARARPAHWLAAETGLLYVQKGYAITRPSLHADYLEVPALVHLELGGEGAAFFLEGGAAGTLLVRCRLIVDDARPCGDGLGMAHPTSWTRSGYSAEGSGSGASRRAPAWKKACATSGSSPTPTRSTRPSCSRSPGCARARAADLPPGTPLALPALARVPPA